MASLFDMFRGPAANAPSAPAPGAPGSGTGAVNPNAAPNGVLPPQGGAGSLQAPPGQQPGVVDTGKAPVPDFAKIWDTPAVDPNAPKPAGLFNITPDQINQAAQQHQFSKGINPELVQKALQGDVQSFIAVIESVGRNVYAQSAYAGTRLIESGVKNFENRFTTDTLPGMLRNHSVDDSLRSSNPIFNDPKYAPMLDSAKNAIVRSYPDATTAEINTMAGNYLQSMVADFAKMNSDRNKGGNPGGSGNQQNNQQNQQPQLITKDAQGRDDWTNFFTPMSGNQQQQTQVQQPPPMQRPFG